MVTSSNNLLHKLYSEMSIRESLDEIVDRLDTGVCIIGCRINNLGNVDIFLLESSVVEAQALVNSLVIISKFYGQEINTIKTKVMTIPNEAATITCEGVHVVLDSICSFRYPGTQIVSDG